MRVIKITCLVLSILCLASCAAAPGVSNTPASDSGIEFFTSYRTYDEVVSYINKLQSEAPDMVRISAIGKSGRNRPIYAVEINSGDRGVLVAVRPRCNIGGVTATLSRRMSGLSKPALYIDAGHHGNEIITTPVALYFLKYLIDHRAEPGIKELLDSRMVYIIPCANPDGYELRQRTNADKVDLNRNYAEAWAPSDPAENEFQYGGKEAFSEPESQAVRDFVASHKDITIALTYHSGIDRIHYSRANPEKPTTHDYGIYTRLSESGRKLTADYGCAPAGISPLTIAPTGGGRGTTLSWLHSQGMYAFTVELYGDGNYPWPITEKYFPPEPNIIDICKRWVPFNLFMLRSVDQQIRPEGSLPEGLTSQPVNQQEDHQTQYIDEALKMLGLDRSAPGFKKDKIDDDYRLQMVQDSLHKPLELPGVCDRIDEQWRNAKSLSDGLKIQINQLGDKWTISNTNIADCPAGINSLQNADNCPKELQPVLNRILPAIYQSHALLNQAFAGLSLPERQYLVKRILPNLILNGDSQKDAFQSIAEKVEMRLSPPDAKPETHGRDVIDPEEVAMLKLTLKINYGYLHQAGMLMASAVDDAITMLKGLELSTIHDARITNRESLIFDTPYGPVIIGGTGNNVYDKDALLIIDLGGNDYYRNRAGGAVGLPSPAISINIDLAGDDFYSSTSKFSQGSALFGIGILADLAGNDTYQAGHYAQGCGMFGIGILWNTNSESDSFSADHLCQGAGGWGIGVLYNQSGDTRYYSRTFSQGLGYTLGAGALVDNAGDDYYIAAGTIENSRPYSMSQGFGQGNRRIASGGVGTLVDSAGNDHYTACFYGQGCAYWYGLGILIDNAGNDRYDAQVYAQGCGIHLSTGVLIDRGGSDFYNCTYGGNAQGAAHDLAVGILLDKNGSDTYIGRGNNQGSAITNSFALFIDEEGDDVYYTTPKGGQGFGGAARDYGSIGIFLDLAGNDFYSEESLNPGCGTGNNKKWLKGDKGAGIDLSNQ